MEYIIENEYLKVTVTTWGAQVKSVIRKCDGVEHIWHADKSVWDFHAPILFPYCGKLVDDRLEAKGRIYESGMHGFARDMEHDFVEQREDSLVMELHHEHLLCPMIHRFPRLIGKNAYQPFDRPICVLCSSLNHPNYT